MKISITRTTCVLVLFVLFLTVSVLYFLSAFNLPGSINLVNNQKYIVKLPKLLPVVLKKSKPENLRFIDNISGINNKDIAIETLREGGEKLNISLFGVIPLKTVDVRVYNEKKVCVVGKTIGIEMKIKGILVSGVTDVRNFEGKEVYPAKNAGLKPGDVILSANKTKINSIKQLADMIESVGGNPINIKIRRANRNKDAVVIPVKSSTDDRYHIGIWCREYIYGIGTLTYYDDKSMVFGALGHGVMDDGEDTLLKIDGGSILRVNIQNIKKGIKGRPGELKGGIIDEEEVLGELIENGENGLYGVLKTEAVKELRYLEYPIGISSQVNNGKAYMLSNIDESEAKFYEVELKKTAKRFFASSQGLIVKIIDPKLLKKTGGIIQGMSGSPIIQNGKIVGALTHVMVNDPRMGYGVFVDKMLDKTSDISQNKKILEINHRS